MAELGSTGGNLDNILQYLLQRIEKFGIAEGGTGGVARFADLSDVPAATSGATKYWGWKDNAYQWLDAPEGGGDVDLSDYYYTKTQVNDLLKGYVKTTDLPDMTEYVLLETYNKGITDVKAWATSEADSAAAAAQGNAIANAKAYTDSKATETLNAANANAATIIEQALEGYATNATAQEYANSVLAKAKSYADEKFVTKADDYEEISGIKQLNGTYTYFKTLYIEPNSSLGGAFVGWQDGTPAMLIREDGRIAYYKGIQGYIELYGEPPFIDFHYGNSTAEFTSRIIESSSGVLELLSNSNGVGTLKIGNAYITYDSDNNALMVSDGSGGAVNLVAMGDVAAFGGLGSGFDTLTDLTLTNKLKAKYIQATSSLTAVSATIGGVKFYEDDDYCPVIDLSGDGESVGYITGADAFIMGRALIKKLQLYDSVEGNYKDIKYDGDNGYVYITINSVKYKFVMEKV